MQVNGAKWNSTNGETKDLVYQVNGVDVNAGPVVLAAGSGTPNIVVKGGTASWRTQIGGTTPNFAFDGRAAFEYKSTTPAELGKHAWGAITIPDDQKPLISFNDGILMQSNVDGPYYIKYSLTPTTYVEGTGWVADNSKPVIAGSTKDAASNPINFKWTGLDDQGRMTFEYDIPDDQTYAIDIRTIVYDNSNGTSYHGGYDLTKQGIIEQTRVAFGGRVDTVIADNASAPADQRTGWSPLGLHPQAFTWQDGVDFAVLYPKAVDDTFTAESGQELIIDPIANDTSMEQYGVTLNRSSVKLIGADGNHVTTLNFPGKGTVTVLTGGKFKINSDPSFTGTFPEFGYYVQDTNKGDSQAVIRGTIVAPPSLEIGLKTLINGQDANDKNNPVVLEPGDYKVDYVISNPNDFELKSSQLSLTNVELGDFTVAPGGTHTVTEQVTVAPGASVLIEPTINATRTLDSGKVLTDSATDPAYAKALVGEIDLNDDEGRTKLGVDFEGDLISNDTSSNPKFPVLPETLRATETDKGTLSEDGKTITVDGQYTVTILDNGKYKVEWEDGATDKVLPVFKYTATNALGDKTEDATVTLSAYEHKIVIEAYLIDENGERVDADTPEEAVKYTETGSKKLVIVLTNPGEEGDQDNVNPEIGYTDKETGEWVSLGVLDGVTIAPGGTHELTIDTDELPEGVYSQDIEVRDGEATDSDPVNAIVELPVIEEDEPEPTPEATPDPTPGTNIVITNDNGNNITITNNGGGGEKTVTTDGVKTGTGTPASNVKVNTGNEVAAGVLGASALMTAIGSVILRRNRKG